MLNKRGVSKVERNLRFPWCHMGGGQLVQAFMLTQSTPSMFPLHTNGFCS